MKQFVLIVVFVIFCAFTVMGKTSWEPPEGGAKVNLIKFLNTSLYIWTLLSTSVTRNTPCKVDKVWNITEKDVFFYRNYSSPTKYSELLEGKFQDWQRKEGPSLMILYNRGGQSLGAEECVYQDENNTCAVFLATNNYLFAGQWYDVCELRVKGEMTGANASNECTEQFLKICDPEQSTSVFYPPNFCFTLVGATPSLKKCLSE
uniref:Lipocalin/cytosolic fatty-acid binding domain-containing protein n=1 Tax=Amblyomma maculatum TaxID=34609 RepID=G3MR47_AMBMU